MVSSSPQTVKFACSACGASYQVPATMAGKRGPCAKCGADVQVPAAPKRKLPDAAVQYVPIECHRCQTRYYGTPDQIGKELKCPDCGARNVLRPPPEVRAKKPLAALEGKQYEVWEVGEQPMSSDVAAAQPTYIAVWCKSCNTLMHGTPNQVGEEIKCPDCGTLNIVPPPPEPPRSVLRDDAPELEIDPKFDPGPRPPTILPPVRRMLYEEEAEAERERKAKKEAARNQGSPAKVDITAPPVLPAWPLVSGILSFLFFRGTPACWLALSIGLAPLVALGLDGLVGFLTPANGQALFVGTMELVLAGLFGLIWSAYASSVFLAVTGETSFGSDEIQDWPSANIFESMPELWQMMVAVSCGSAAGWVAGFALSGEPWAVAAAGLGSLWLFFPIVLLSQMAGASSVALIDGHVSASLGRFPGSWLLFYIETALLAAICVATFAIAIVAPYLVLAAFTPLYVAGLLLYARLLGRLAWRIADTLPAAGKRATQEK